MKITKIEIQNYRAFYGNDYVIETDKKNVLIYGENGSGKSSLYRALEDFFRSANNEILDKKVKFVSNIFNEREDGKVTIHFTGRDGTSSIPLDMGVPFDTKDGFDKIFSVSDIPNGKFVKDIGKQNPFFTYKRILETFLFNKEQEDKVEQILFKLLIKDILGSYETTPTELEKNPVRNLYKRLENGDSDLEKVFNDIIEQLFEDLSVKTNDFLNSYFSTNLEIKLSLAVPFEITNPKINIEVKLFDKEVPRHHDFLNEARLSALAICMYLASLKITNPPSVLKLLVLDDIFIGLDMSNRLPLLDILKNEFSDYQIFLTTYDRQWFELSKQWFENKTDKEWKFYEMYVDNFSNEGFEVPKIISDKSNLDKAVIHFKNHDYPASANYLRKAVEELIQHNFHKLLYTNNDGELTEKLSGKLESIIKYLKSIDYNSINSIVYQSIIDLNLYIQFIANPLSHYETDTQIFKGELKKIENAIRKIQPIKFNDVKILFPTSEIIYLQLSISNSLTKIYQFKTLDKILIIELEGNKCITNIEIKSISYEEIEGGKEVKNGAFGFYQKYSFSDVLQKMIEHENSEIKERNKKQEQQENLLSLPNWQTSYFKYEEDNTTKKSLNQLATQN